MTVSERIGSTKRWRALALLACLAAAPGVQAADSPIEAFKEEIETGRLKDRLHNVEQYELIEQREDWAVVSVVGTYKPASDDIPAWRMNVYGYLSKQDAEDPNWKYDSGALGVPGSLARLVGRLASEDPTALPPLGGMSTKQMAQARRMYNLAGSTDDAFAKHFLERRKDFEAIKSFLLRSAKAGDAGGAKPFSQLSGRFPSALVAYGYATVLAGYGDAEEGGCSESCFTLVVGFAPPEFKVGYFYLPEGKAVPTIHPREYLVIRPLGGGWYFFRQS